MILCIETATTICSVALCHDGKPVRVMEKAEEKSHASSITVFIEHLLKEEKTDPGMLDAVAVSKGPGSYTGLRIGVSVAKGIAYASDIPLLAISTTEIMYQGAKQKGRYDYYCPMIDARRMEVYTAVYDYEGNEVKPVTAEVLTPDSFSDILNKGTVLFFGDGTSKFKDIARHPSAHFFDSFSISSRFMCSPAKKLFDNRIFEDVAYFEPYYLKDFIATVPKKNMPGNIK